MRSSINFYYWGAAAWAATLALYLLGWSDLNTPLDHRLRLFLVLTVAALFGLGLWYSARDQRSSLEYRPAPSGQWITAGIVLGFFADFAYRGGVPLLSGAYQGYDVTLDVQATVGIPVVHVALIGGTILYSIMLAQEFAHRATRGVASKFLLLQFMLILNYSRGYVAFCLLGALLVLVANHKNAVLTRRFRAGLGASIAAYFALIGIGMFGNMRSGYGWFDSSQISRIGFYNDSYPGFLSSQLKWAYTYATSPLANLNYNVSTYPGAGAVPKVLLAFLPDTITKYALAGQFDVAYQVDYLNAATGYAPSYYLGGGIIGLYTTFVVMALLLGLGARVARRTPDGGVLYGAVATIVTVGYIFFNTLSNTATCFLVPMALLVSLYRARSAVRLGGLHAIERSGGKATVAARH